MIRAAVKFHAFAIIVFMLLFAMAFTGCASAPEKTTAPIVNEIQIPVRVSCITTAPSSPQFHTDAELKSLDDYHLALALILDRIKRANYQAELEAVVEGCK